MKKLFLLTLFALMASVVDAQTTSVTISGTVVAVDFKEPAIGALIQLNPQDSISKTGQKIKPNVVGTDISGGFSIVSRRKTNRISITFPGYVTKVIDLNETTSRTLKLDTIYIEPDPIQIDDAIVVAKVAMAQVKGDTVQYNAGAFKTNPDATAEDLLKKLPGVSTDGSGNAQSQGKTITKVLVDGKEFFESDPAAALKTLPADAVESMQLFDSQTDDAKFSGFDDGERIRTLNIKTKPGVMKSVFGKAYLGGGLYAPHTDVTDRSARYAAGLGINVWRGDHRFTLTAQVNNVNNQGFTLSDIAAGGGGGGFRGGGGQSGADLSGFSTGVGGIKQTYMAGFNYNGTFSEKFKMSASYFYTGANGLAMNQTRQDYLTMRRIYESGDTTVGSQNRHSINIRTEWNPNENNRITFIPSLSYSNNFGDRASFSRTFTDDVKSNEASNYYRTELQRLSGGAMLAWRHSFGKTGRTINITGNFSSSRDMGDRMQVSEYTNLKNSQGKALLYDTTLMNKIGSVRGDGYSLRGGVTYSEPLSKRSRLSLSYSINYDKTISDRQSMNYDYLMHEYSLIDTSGTNYFNRNYTSHNVGLGYSYVYEKIFTLGATIDYQNSTTNNDQKSPSLTLTRFDRYSFSSFNPALFLNYNPVKGQNLMVRYRMTSRFPSVNQLQDVLDTQNPLNVSKGNPNLKQTYVNNLYLNYNYADIVRNINFSVGLSGSVTDNTIAWHNRFIQKDTMINGTLVVKGAQFSEPINMSEGAQNAGLFANFGFGLKNRQTQINYLNFNFSLNYNYSKSPSIENKVRYLSYNNYIGGSVQATSNISENVDFTIRYAPSVSLTQAGTGRFDRYYSHNLSAFVNIIFLKYFFVNANVNWNNTFGTQNAYTNHYIPINAAIGAKFLANRQAEVRLQCNDLLDQNRSTTQSVRDTYTQITTTNILRQYFMLSFTYKFDTRKNNRSVTRSEDNGDSRRYRPDGGGMPMRARPMGGGMM